MDHRHRLLVHSPKSLMSRELSPAPSPISVQFPPGLDAQDRFGSPPDSPPSGSPHSGSLILNSGSLESDSLLGSPAPAPAPAPAARRERTTNRKPFQPKPGSGMFYRTKYLGSLKTLSSSANYESPSIHNNLGDVGNEGTERKENEFSNLLHDATDSPTASPSQTMPASTPTTTTNVDDGFLDPPESVLPSHLFDIFEFVEDVVVPGHHHRVGGKQRSYQTIFSIYTTLLGSCTISLPWGFSCGGLGISLLGTFIIMSISFYTASIVLRRSAELKHDMFEGTVRHYLGAPGFYVCLFASILVFIGVLFSCAVMMSTALYNLMCLIPLFENSVYWTPQLATFPILYFLFPLSMLKNFTIFVRLSAMGVVFVFTIIIVILSSSLPHLSASFSDLWDVQPTVPYLAGLLFLGFFNHNAILSLMKHQKNPQHNVRDAYCSFFLVALTYAIVGGCGYLGHRGVSIPQNYLEIFPHKSVLGVVGRVGIICQQMVVFPLLLSCVRIQFFGTFFSNQYPSILLVAIMNLVVFAGCAAMGMWYRNVGDIMRFAGAGVGSLYIFTLPPVVHVMSRWSKWFKATKLEFSSRVARSKEEEEEGTLINSSSLSFVGIDGGIDKCDGSSWWKWFRLIFRFHIVSCETLVHSLIPIFGFTLLVLQFVPPSVFRG